MTIRIVLGTNYQKESKHSIRKNDLLTKKYEAAEAFTRTAFTMIFYKDKNF